MKNDYSVTLEKVIALVSAQTGIEESKLNENTKIEDDVGLVGLDTIEFYEEFFTEFQIDNPQDFDSNKYISPENIDIFSILKSIFSKKTNHEFDLKNNTIRHLTNVALRKRWYEE
ncbi:MAG: DUF1493 family protein [Arcicella sp.]|nr:DUF1493 family protein [Arcicella sp.]